MSSDSDWRDSYGELKLPFFGAAGQILDGNFHVNCPNCSKNTLRFYYHVFDREKRTGTLWAWCSSCRIVTHLPRVSPKCYQFPDPFEKLSLDEFGEVEGDSSKPFVQRLDNLWVEGAIGVPQPLKEAPREDKKPRPFRH